MFSTAGSDVDAKWKGAIERALASFDTVSEWADYISFLSRLQKAIKSRPARNGPIPLASQVSEHLARCLEPSLPAGVHQTTLDLYNTVFTTLSPEELYGNINIWLPGVLPVVSYAAFSVKPLVVQFLQQRVLPCPSLRELCRPLLLACVPSLDEEGSECFEDILNLIQKLREKLNDDILFWETLFLCVVTSMDCRLGALTYFGRQLPAFTTPLNVDASLAISPEPGLFIRALCCGLADDNILVQRGFLDVLVKHLPLDSPVFEKTQAGDSQKLMFSACKLISRKDMSLNRRLWAWLLGPEPDPTETQHLSRVEFFSQYGLDPLVSVLLSKISTNNANEFARTCQIIHGLMDRWELAYLVVPKLLIAVIQRAMTFGNETASTDAVSHLLNGVEANFIWQAALDLILCENYDTVRFMVETFDVKDMDMVLAHVPPILLVLTQLMKETSATASAASLARALLNILSPESLSLIDENNKFDPTDVTEKVKLYYADSLDASKSDAEVVVGLPFSKEQFTYALASNLVDLYVMSIDTSYDDSAVEPRQTPLIVEFVRLLPEFDYRFPKLIDAVLQERPPDTQVFSIACSTMTESERLTWSNNLASYCFGSLSSTGFRQVELVRSFWAAYETWPNSALPSALSTKFAQDSNTALQVAKAFSAFWIHSVERANFAQILTKPTFLFLDLLSSRDLESLNIAKYYLRTAVVVTGTAEKLLKLFLESISQSTLDGAVLSYYMRTLYQVLETKERSIRKVYHDKFIQPIFECFFSWRESSNGQDNVTFQNGLGLLQLSYSGDLKPKNVEFLSKTTVRLIEQAKSGRCCMSLLRFTAAMLPQLQFSSKVTFGNEESFEYMVYNYLSENIDCMSDEVELSGVSALLESFLHVFKESLPQVVSPLTRSLVKRQTSLDERLFMDTLDCLGDEELLIGILLVIEKLFLTNFQLLYGSSKTPITEYGEHSPSGSMVHSATSNLFGNVISGVFSVESPSERSAVEDGRVMLYEAVELVMEKCCQYWGFVEKSRGFIMHQSDYSTALHITSRLKTRVRKLTSLIYKYQPSECLKLTKMYSKNIQLAVRLVHVYDMAQYKQTVDMLIEEVSSRTNSKTSIYASSEKEPETIDSASFLVAYVSSLETDVTEEVWPSLIKFVSEVGSRHSQHSTILLSCLRLSSVMGEKLENSNTAQKKRMKKELSDNVQKIIYAALTELSADTLLSGPIVGINENIAEVARQVPSMIAENEKQIAVFSRIFTTLVVPALKTQTNLSKAGVPVFELLRLIVELSPTNKFWRPNVTDMLMDHKLLTISFEQEKLLMPVIAKWVAIEKERVNEFLARVANYGSNSVLFGWSGSEELTNDNLLRLGLFFLSCDNLQLNYSKLVNQLSSIWNNRVSIPYVCIFLRALLIGGAPGQLTMIYSFIAFKLQDLFRDVLDAATNEKIKKSELRNPLTENILIEAAKLLDFAVTLNADQFQLYEWLFLCDNTDAIYPHDEERSGDIVGELSTKNIIRQFDEGLTGVENLVHDPESERRKPLLARGLKFKDLSAYFSQASVAFYETSHAMSRPDEPLLRQIILQDILSE